MLVGISSDKINDDDNNSSMHHLLKTLLSGTLNTADKLAIIEKDYNDIKVDDTFRKDVNDMCNLGEGLVERTIEETTEKVSKEVTERNTKNFVLNMYEADYTYDQIAKVTKLSIKEVKDILNKKLS